MSCIFQHGLDSHLSSSSFAVGDYENDDNEIILLLSPKNNFNTKNFSLETGLIWSQPYSGNSSYFPFINVGLRYQSNNFERKKILMNLELEDINGALLQSASSQTNYKFFQDSLLAIFKVDLYRWGRVMPYVDFGLGASWNKIQTTPFVFTTSDNKKTSFKDNELKITNFTHEIGVGFDFLITNQFWLSLGYKYNNYGKVKLSKLNSSSGDPVNDDKVNRLLQPFDLGKLATHSIQLTGRYLFG